MRGLQESTTSTLDSSSSMSTSPSRSTVAGDTNNDAAIAQRGKMKSRHALVHTKKMASHTTLAGTHTGPLNADGTVPVAHVEARSQALKMFQQKQLRSTIATAKRMQDAGMFDVPCVLRARVCMRHANYPPPPRPSRHPNNLGKEREWADLQSYRHSHQVYDVASASG